MMGKKCEQERGELQLAELRNFRYSGISGQQSGLESTLSEKTGRTYHQFSVRIFEDMIAAGTAAQISRDAGIQDAAESLRGRFKP